MRDTNLGGFAATFGEFQTVKRGNRGGWSGRAGAPVGRREQRGVGEALGNHRVRRRIVV